MKIFSKLIQKHSNHSKKVILPPPLEEKEDEEAFPKDLPLPIIEDPDLKQMERTWFIFDRDQHLVERKIKDRQRKKEDWEKSNQEFEDELQKRKENMSLPTAVIPKDASLTLNQIVRMCSQYYDLCRKF